MPIVTKDDDISRLLRDSGLPGSLLDEVRDARRRARAAAEAVSACDLAKALNDAQKASFVAGSVAEAVAPVMKGAVKTRGDSRDIAYRLWSEMTGYMDEFSELSKEANAICKCSRKSSGRSRIKD